MTNKCNLTGQTFTRLTVIKEAEPYINPNTGKKAKKYLCQCSCGNQTTVRASHLKNCSIKSCGCLRDETASKKWYKHGHTTNKQTSNTYYSWTAMKSRCDSRTDRQYKYYGGRGIAYNPKWSKFENFLADMGEAPQGLTIERVNVNGSYCKENCVWATDKQQANNTRRNVFITYQGKTQTIAQWADELGIKYVTLQARLQRGWTVEEALTIPVGIRRNKAA